MYETCKKAVDTFGKEKQINMAVEEMAELMVALNHWRRGRATKDEVLEEIADSYIMLLQLSIIVTDAKDYSPLYKKIQQKLQRLAWRIEQCQ